MIVFLTSHMGGHPVGDHNTALPFIEDNAFMDQLKARWPENAKVLLMTADPAQPELLDARVKLMSASCRLSGLSLHSMTPCDDRNAEVTERLNDFDVIIFSGGHVPTQNAFFQKIHLKEKMKDYHGILITISAGTMNCASTVYAHPELNGEAVDPAYQRFIPGLGITELQILPHFQWLRTISLDGLDAIREIAASDSFGRTFHCLNDGSYVLIENGVSTLYGESYTLHDGVLTQICKDNQSILL